MVERVDIVDDLDVVEQTVERVSEATQARDLLELVAELPGLGERAVAILEMRHGLTGEEPMTLDEIGKQFGVTRERIRQIEKKALQALREHSSPGT